MPYKWKDKKSRHSEAVKGAIFIVTLALCIIGGYIWASPKPKAAEAELLRKPCIEYKGKEICV